MTSRQPVRESSARRRLVEAVYIYLFWTVCCANRLLRNARMFYYLLSHTVLGLTLLLKRLNRVQLVLVESVGECCIGAIKTARNIEVHRGFYRK